MLKMPQMAGYHGVSQQTGYLKYSWGTIWVLKVNTMIEFLLWILDALNWTYFSVTPAHCC